MYDDLLGDLSDCMDRVVGGDVNHPRMVSDLIERCRRAIVLEKGVIGTVELQELDKAREACDTGYLRFALSSVRKALVASERQEKADG